MLRLVIAGVMGGIVMFVWSAIAHIATPLGAVGLKPLASDAPVAPMQAATGDKGGLYFFPNRRGPDGPLTEQQYARKLESAPQGIIAYQPSGSPMMAPSQLIGEFALEIVEALVLAFLLRNIVMHTIPGRTAYAAVVGLIVVITTNGSYMNWYGFPLDYTLAQAFMQWVGFVLAGGVIAVVYNWARKKPAS